MSATIAILVSCLALASSAVTQEADTTPYDIPPKILKQRKPSYPDEAFRSRTEGIVVVEFVIDEQGRAQDLRVIQSVAGLDSAAVDAIRKWRFAPARKAGKPVRSKATAPLTFCIFKEGCRALQAKAQRAVE